MGWLVWILETGMCLGASWLVAAALYPERGVLHRLIALLLVAPALLLIPIQALGLVGLLRPMWLGLLAPVGFAIAAGAAWRVLGGERTRLLARADLGAPARLVREALSEREPAVLTCVLTVGVWLFAVLLVWIYKSWTWDPVWYHVPITGYAIQTGSLDWIDTSVPWTQSHPKNIELLALWNCIFPSDNRLDDSSQLPFAVLGAAVTAAWAREVGARPAFAAGVGAAWVLLPPMFLQMWSTHVDLACGAFLSAAVFFLRERPNARDRWMSLLAFGLYTGTKMTGAFHLLMLGPWIALRGVWELRNAHGGRWRIAANQALSVLALMAVGSFKYFQNLWKTGNPLWAFKVKVPLLGTELPGLFDPAQFYGSRPGESPLFFGSPGAVLQLLRSWYVEPPVYWPDVRTGGFGPLFAYLLVPCLVWLVLELWRPRHWKHHLPVLALALAALTVQSAWWPRFVMGVATAGLVALGSVQGRLGRALPRLGLSLLFLGLTGVTFWRGASAQVRERELFMYPKHFEETLRSDPSRRAALQVVNWLWPTEWNLRKEQELRAGDVVAYDQSVNFLGEFFTRDYRTRVEYVPSNGDLGAYLARIDALKPRWVGVEGGSQAEWALREWRGAEYLFHAPRSGIVLYRMPQ
ncbi:hypothetical protein [Melittangium boletus]|uniref:Glycosyltransferase RgtA/B/C/D-like domain-containing protein n=1 Tax=Melittangium boletus DSM 14713 TaxID=1294270 RepID=A0A250IPT2_9BACT|nr:hypothetical protein [Melittangium boletus]ATB33181.1 hypothetical protein MEBOL_006670 [Melittangium boletus DSM 14713]